MFPCLENHEKTMVFACQKLFLSTKQHKHCRFHWFYKFYHMIMNIPMNITATLAHCFMTKTISNWLTACVAIGDTVAYNFVLILMQNWAVHVHVHGHVRVHVCVHVHVRYIFGAKNVSSHVSSHVGRTLVLFSWPRPLGRVFKKAKKAKNAKKAKKASWDWKNHCFCNVLALGTPKKFRKPMENLIF